MTFEKANVTRIEVEEEDITTASGCIAHANQQQDANHERIVNCDNAGFEKANPNCPHGNSNNGKY